MKAQRLINAIRTYTRRFQSGWQSPQEDGTIRVIFYYPRTDTFRLHHARPAFVIEDDGVLVTEDEFLRLKHYPRENTEWTLTHADYFIPLP